MPSLFLPRDSESVRNDDGSLAVVYVADVDVDSGEIRVIPGPTPYSIMARQVMFHKNYLLDVVEENITDIGPTREILRRRLELLTERAKAHIQRQRSYASAYEAYASVLSSSYSDGLNLLDQRDFDDASNPQAWGVESMSDIMKPINYHVVFPEVPAAPSTSTSTTAAAIPVPEASSSSATATSTSIPSRGSKRVTPDEPSSSVDSLPKRARLDSDVSASTGNGGNLPHLTTPYTTYYSDPSTKGKKRSRSDSDEEDRAPKRVRQLPDTILTPLPLDDDDLTDADAEGEDDEDYTPAITPEVARPSPTTAPSTAHEPHPVVGCGPRATQGFKMPCMPMTYHTAMPRRTDVDDPLYDAEDHAANDELASAAVADDPVRDDDSHSVYQPPSRSPTPVPIRSSRRLRSRNTKPYDRPSTTKSRASTKKSKSRASTSRSTSSRASSSSKPFVPDDDAAAAIGSNCKFPRTIRRFITPVDAPGHINLGLDNAYYKCPPPACSVCGKLKGNTGDLSRHILSHIVWGDKRVNQCRSCPVSYARKDALTRHLKHNPGHRGQYDALCPEFWVKYEDYSQHVVLDLSADE
ncbi:uncharacterized protein SCHCODRAFT_02584847 [Schizophyllum commune H4-8]|uniref:C2H2-type domain-containing protein n=1 Tax=Schizophyllum commune (strain H4-8 / FGSC 9210) TaxID=578458 RepID=D8QB42_SCHCM|nr:uncharacterized protein SCHCODRAFT_02584847 [Schizophyllum commune H4-8]KAI5889026.1 hypothetical protein SCHCODRAFT_02584847 [Schizophyllum commune H4-8]